MPSNRIARRTALAAFAVGSAGLALPPMPATAAEGRLVLAFIPQENPEKLIGDIKVISDYLSQDLGMPVASFVTTDHAAAIEACATATPTSRSWAPCRSSSRNGRSGRFQSWPKSTAACRATARIFVRRDGDIETLADLKGRSIAFADPISESGYLYPATLFYDAGLVKKGAELDTFFAGGYQQSVQALTNGLVDCMGSSQYLELLLTPEQQADVTWIAESGPIPPHVVIARPGLPGAGDGGAGPAGLALAAHARPRAGARFPVPRVRPLPDRGRRLRDGEAGIALRCGDAEGGGERPPAYFTPDWPAAKRSVERLAALRPETTATGHGTPMRGADLRQGLERLVLGFDEIAVPDQGHYVQER